MRRPQKRWGWFCVLATLISSSPALAQTEQTEHPRSNFSFGLSGGATVPISDLRQGSSTGWHASGFLTIRSSLPVQVRLEGTYQQLTGKPIPSMGGTVHPHFTGFTINGVWNGPQVFGIRPYIIGGPGAYRTGYGLTCGTMGVNGWCPGEEIPGTEARTPVAETRFGVNAGGGLAFHLAGASMFAEARWHDVFTTQRIFPASTKRASQIVPISIGMTW